MSPRLLCQVLLGAGIKTEMTLHPGEERWRFKLELGMCYTGTGLSKPTQLLFDIWRVKVVFTSPKCGLSFSQIAKQGPESSHIALFPFCCAVCLCVVSLLLNRACLLTANPNLFFQIPGHGANQVGKGSYINTWSDVRTPPFWNCCRESQPSFFGGLKLRSPLQS